MEILAELTDPAVKRRKCLLVLGMHRSGTSALSGLLAALGAQRPKRELPPQADNKLGFFEPSEIVAIHDRFLSALGTDWKDWRTLPDNWRCTPCFRDALHDLEAAVRLDFEGDGTFLVKDPRICRFVDLWVALAERIQADLVAIHIFRTPIEVASSLRVRDGLDEAQTRLLWLRHVLEAEAATRHLPRAFVSFAGLLAGSAEEIARAGKFIDLGIEADAPARAAVERFVDPGMKRQFLDPSDGQDVLGRWIKSSYSMLERLNKAPDDRAASKTLDRLRSEFDRGCEAFGPLVSALSDKSNGLEQEVRRLRIAEDERDVLMRSLRAVTWASDRIPALEAELEAARSRMSEMALEVGRAAVLDGEIAIERERNSGLETVAARVPDLEQLLAAARCQLEAMETASRESAGLLASLVAERERLSEGLTSRDAEMAAMLGEVATLSATAARVPGLELEIAAARSLLDDEKRSHDDTRCAADTVRADCASLTTRLVETEIVAARIPSLEQALADAKARTELLSRQLGNRKELLRRLFFAET